MRIATRKPMTMLEGWEIAEEGGGGGRRRKEAVAAAAGRTKAGHDAAQEVGPVAGTELPAIAGLAQDDKFACLFSLLR